LRGIFEPGSKIEFLAQFAAMVQPAGDGRQIIQADADVARLNIL